MKDLKALKAVLLDVAGKLDTLQGAVESLTVDVENIQQENDDQVMKQALAWMQENQELASEQFAVLVGAEADLKVFFQALQSYFASRGNDEQSPLYTRLAKSLKPIVDDFG